MKLLIAFAVIAVASAAEQVQVVRLPAAPAPVVIPQAVLDAMVVLPVSENDILRVNFVDAPIEIDAKAVPEQVLAYDSTVAEETKAFEVDDESLKVRFVDSPVQEEIVEAVRVAMPVFKNEVPSVDAIKIADAFRPGKVFEDPRLRSKQIKIAEVPSTENLDGSFASKDLKVRVVEVAALAKEVQAFETDEEPLKVNFVDSPVQVEQVDAVRIAEPVFKNEAPSVDAIKIVDAPRPGKVFADPRLR